jgi:hypothetical protein
MPTRNDWPEIAMAKLADDIILQHHHISELGEDLAALARVNPDSLDLSLPFDQVAAFAATDTHKAIHRMSQDHGPAFYHAVFLAMLDRESLAQELQEQCLKEEPDFDRGIKRGLKMALELLQDAESSEAWSNIITKRINTHFGTAVNSD